RLPQRQTHGHREGAERYPVQAGGHGNGQADLLGRGRRAEHPASVAAPGAWAESPSPEQRVPRISLPARPWSAAEAFAEEIAGHPARAFVIVADAGGDRGAEPGQAGGVVVLDRLGRVVAGL